jgi:hypothetical protein
MDNQSDGAGKTAPDGKRNPLHLDKSTIQKESSPFNLKMCRKQGDQLISRSRRNEVITNGSLSRSEQNAVSKTDTRSQRNMLSHSVSEITTSSSDHHEESD